MLWKRYPSLDPRELCFHFIPQQAPPLPGSPPQPLFTGWLLEAKATALPGATLAAANLARDSTDPEQRRASGCSGFVKASSLISQGVGGWLLQRAGSPPPPHQQHLSSIYRHTNLVDNSSGANQSGCFRNKLFFCLPNHPGA